MSCTLSVITESSACEFTFDCKPPFEPFFVVSVGAAAFLSGAFPLVFLPLVGFIFFVVSERLDLVVSVWIRILKGNILIGDAITFAVKIIAIRKKRLMNFKIDYE